MERRSRRGHENFEYASEQETGYDTPLDSKVERHGHHQTHHSGRNVKSEARVQFNPKHKQRKKRKEKHRHRTRSRSIEIEISIPPPCEPQVNKRQTRKPCIQSAPCHRNWEQGYHPTSTRYEVSTTEGTASYTCDEEEEEDTCQVQYNPVEQCHEPTGLNGFFSNLTQSLTYDKDNICQPEQASQVNIEITMANDDEGTNPKEQRSQIGGRGPPASTSRGTRNPDNNGVLDTIRQEREEVERKRIAAERRFASENQFQENRNERELPSSQATDGVQSQRPPPPVPPPPPSPAPPIPPLQTSRMYGKLESQINSAREAENAALEEQRRRWNRSSDHRHSFPFTDTASGNLKIDKRLVSFETPKVAVLVADPDHTKLQYVRNEHHKTGESMTVTATFHPDETPRTIPVFQYEQPQQYEEPCTSNAAYKLLPTRTMMSSSRLAPVAVDRGYETEPSHYSSHRGGSRTLMGNLHHRLQRAINPDTTVLIGDKEFPVHLLALQCYSTYFDKQRRPKSQMMQIRIPPEVLSSDDFPSLMDWILMDEREKRGVINKKNVVSLFSGATFLGINQLRQDCLDFIRNKMEEGDPVILNMYEEARNRKLTELMSILATKLSRLFPKIYKSGQFLHMTPRELILILSSDNIAIHSELDVYDAAIRWLLYDWTNRKEHTVEVLKTVRFGLLTPLQLTQLRYSAENTSLPEYPQIFSYQEVIKIIEAATTYSILKENYQGHPGEFHRWLLTTKVEPPRERQNLRAVPPESSSSPPFGFVGDNHIHRKDKKKKKKKKTVTEEVIEASNRQLEDGNALPQEYTRHHSSSRSGGQKPERTTEQDDGSWDTLGYGREKVRAAILIQSYVRRWLARRRYFKLKTAAIVAQAAFRASQKKIPITPSGPRKRQGEIILLFGGRVPRLFSDSETEESNSNSSTGSILQFDQKNNVWKFGGPIPAPRCRMGTVHIGKLIYVFGGEDPTVFTARGKPQPCNDTWSLEIGTGKWRKLSNMTTHRSHFGYELAYGKIYVFGGCDREGNALSSCEVYDPTEDEWHRFHPMDKPRLGTAVAKSGDKIWIVGGMTKDRNEWVTSTTIVYDIRQDKYYKGPDLPLPRYYATLTAYYNELVLIGGIQLLNDEKRMDSTSDVSRLSNGAWVSVGQLKTGPRHSHCAPRLGKYVLIIGGINTRNGGRGIQECETYNVEKFHGSTKIAPLPEALTGMSAVVIKNT